MPPASMDEDVLHVLVSNQWFSPVTVADIVRSTGYTRPTVEASLDRLVAARSVVALQGSRYATLTSAENRSSREHATARATEARTRFAADNGFAAHMLQDRDVNTIHWALLADLADEIDRLRTELDEVRRDHDSLASDVDGLRSDIDRVERRIDDTD